MPSSGRLHPISVTLQRYLANDLVLQDYMIPAKVGTAGLQDLPVRQEVGADCIAYRWGLLPVFLELLEGPWQQQSLKGKVVGIVGDPWNVAGAQS